MTQDNSDNPVIEQTPSQCFTPDPSLPDKGAIRQHFMEYLIPFSYTRIKETLTDEKTIKSKQLINKINHINFIEGSIWIHLQHRLNQNHFLLPVQPAPCQGDTAVCLLPCLSQTILETYNCLNLIIPSDDAVIVSQAEIESVIGNAIHFRVTQKNKILNTRKSLRYSCLALSVELSQNAFTAKGTLVDFSPLGLCVKLESGSAALFNWFNPDAPVAIRVFNEASTTFSSLCRYVRHIDETSKRFMVLTPVMENVHQFQKTKVRNPRRQLTPSFEVIFTHPFSGKPVRRMVFDISTSGFSVLEKSDHGALVPGMIISDLIISYAGTITLKCNKAQVLYRKTHENGTVRCGVAILDMNIKAYTDLTNIISSTFDPHTHISDRIDLEALWNFFFESGFIYPEKYKHIHDIRSTFKETYQRLYSECPEIARHFTYQVNGKIYGHVSMVRAYERTWMFHHLSAKAVKKNLIGFIVLKHLNHFMNEVCRFPSMNLDYLICYFRPQNKFSNLIFGGFAKRLDRPNAVSSDVFSYLLYPKVEKLRSQLPGEWHIRNFLAEDLSQLDQCYKHQSKGLLVDGFNLGQKQSNGEPLEDVYAKGGFLRKVECYSLLRSDMLKAVLIVDQTDFGFNLSNLLNGIKILICDPSDLPWDVLSTAVDSVIGVYHYQKVPLLIHPADYIHEKRLPFEQKDYVLITLDARYYEEFILYTKEICKIGYWE